MTYYTRLAKFMTNDLKGICKKRGLQVTAIKPKELALVMSLEHAGYIDRKTARQTVEAILDANEPKPL